jgi:hypothetical protein
LSCNKHNQIYLYHSYTQRGLSVAFGAKILNLKLII